MYEFHYDFMRKYFNKNQCKVLYTDTDSFLYEFRSKPNEQDIDPYVFKRNNSYAFDTSDFAENNPFGIKRLNNKVLGLMKDELNGEFIEKFIGLRSKMYCIRTLNSEKPKMLAKGVKGSVLDTKISFEDYEQCLKELRVLHEQQSCMRSVKHTVYNITNNKKVLDPMINDTYFQTAVILLK